MINLKIIFLKKYLYPKPCMLGPKIIYFTNSCIDISDGLFGDLSKLLNSTMGINIYISKIPFCNNTKKLIDKKIIDIPKLLNGGDDYELIFSCSQKNEDEIIKIALNNKIKISKVGKIIDRQGIYIDGSKLTIPNNSYQYYF